MKTPILPLMAALALLAAWAWPEHVYLMPFATIIVMVCFLYAVQSRYMGAVEQVKANPFRAGSLMGSLGGGLRIDGVLDPLDAAISLRSAVGAGIASYALPVRNMRINGADVLALGNGAEAVLAYFRGEGPAPRV